MKELNAGHCLKCESGRYFRFKPAHTSIRFDKGEPYPVEHPAGLYCRSCGSLQADIHFRDRPQRFSPEGRRLPQLAYALRSKVPGITRTCIPR